MQAVWFSLVVTGENQKFLYLVEKELNMIRWIDLITNKVHFIWGCGFVCRNDEELWWMYANWHETTSGYVDGKGNETRFYDPNSITWI